jgi:DNA invertase Pin-like site-specific DNA recombinase
MDGYVRISRRAGREGESFISAEVQRRKITDWARLHEVEIIEWWEEIDQSGAKLERPLFQQALARCEAGETGGIVVARLDRFARSAVDALESIKRMNESGARLVSVEDNFDGSTPMGRFAIGILTLIAELELERIKENWGEAVREAIGRGVYIAARVPAGYARGESGRLVRVEPDASIVAEAFRKRAIGASWTELARFLEENGAYPASGNMHWSTVGVSGMIRNRAYLGEARQGEIVNPHAHEPIITEAEFDAAQSSRTLLKPRHDGSIASQALLGGLVRCAGCGHTLKITGSTDGKTGTRYPTYYCIGRYAKGFCPARATIRASYLDRYVEEQVLAVLADEGGLLAEAVAASEQIEQAARGVEAAEHELDLFVTDPKLLSLLGQEKFLQGVEARQRALDEARRVLAKLRSQSALANDLIGGDLLVAWPTLSLQEKRRLMHGLLDCVVLRRAEGRGKAAVPVAERTQIVLRGNVVLGDNPEDRSSIRVRLG